MNHLFCKNLKIILIILVIFLPIISACGCEVGLDDKTLNLLNKAINDLDNSNRDWQSILNDLIKDLPEETQSTIRNEIQNTLDRAIATTGTEFRCNADFVRDRVKEDLIRIRAEITHERVPPRKPVFCGVNPAFIDKTLSPEKRTNIVITGYDFDYLEKPKVYLLDENGIEKDVSQALSYTHHYMMVLNTGGNGVPISQSSQKIILKWKDEILSQIPIMDSTCKNVEVPPYRPKPIYYEYDMDKSVPTQRNPQISIGLYNYSSKIAALVNWGSKEYKGIDIYTPPNGYEVLKITSPSYEILPWRPVLITEGPQDVYLGSGLVESYTSSVITPTRFSWSFNLNPINIVLHQVNGCTNPPVNDCLTALYQYYNAGNGDHFYSTDPNTPSGYKSEGITGYISKYQLPGTTAIYRYYNPSNGDHFYYKGLETPQDYVPEGITGYIATSQLPGTMPLYQWLNIYNGDHYYTQIGIPPKDYKWEGITGYVWTCQSCGSSG